MIIEGQASPPLLLGQKLPLVLNVFHLPSGKVSGRWTGIKFYRWGVRSPCPVDLRHSAGESSNDDTFGGGGDSFDLMLELEGTQPTPFHQQQPADLPPWVCVKRKIPDFSSKHIRKCSFFELLTFFNGEHPNVQ